MAPAAPAGGGDHGMLDRLLQRRDATERERQELLATTTKLRSGALTLAIVLVLADLLLGRFIYIAAAEQRLLTALPLVLLVATGLLDLLHNRPQLMAKATEVDRLEQEVRSRGGGTLVATAGDRRTEMGTWVVTAYYLVPLVVIGGLGLWRLS